MAYIPQDGCVSELLEVQHTENFWYEGRKRVLETVFEYLLNKFSPQVSTYLDYGAGTGEFAAWVKQRLNTAKIMAADSSPEMLNAACSRGILTASVPLAESITNLDLVTMFDVLEHIADDEKFLTDLHSRMAAGGYLMISVPAHPWLFGSHDIRVGHYRRYSAKDLEKTVRNAGFMPIWQTWYNCFLFPAMVAVRLKERSKDEEKLTTLPPFLNGLFGKIFASERWFVSRRLFPVGASLILIARA